MISKRIQNTMESSAAMGNMFTAGERLAKRFGAENVYNFSIGNPNVPAPASVREALVRIAGETPEVELHSYTPPVGLPAVRKTIAEHDREEFGVDLSEKNIFITAGAAAGLNAVFLTLLDEGDAKDATKLKAAVLTALVDEDIAAGSAHMRDDLRSCCGPSGAADFIEQIAAD